MSDGPDELGVSGWFAGSFANVTDPADDALRANLYTLTDDDWYISPGFGVTEGQTITVSYDFAITAWNTTDPGTLGSDDEIRLVYSYSGSDWQTLALYDSSSVVSNTGQLETFDLDIDQTGTLTFAFWTTDGDVDDTADNDIFFDNFTIDATAAPLSLGTIEVTNVSCAGDSDGSISIEVLGGTAPYSFATNGAGLDNLPAGSYTVTITDADGATLTTDPITITEPAALTGDAPTGTNETALGANDGTASVSNLAGGTGAITVSWSNGATGLTISGLAPGEYCATATDANGCTADLGCYTVQEGPTATHELSGLLRLELAPNPTLDQTTLQLELNEAARLRVEVLNGLGQVVSVENTGTTRQFTTTLDLANVAAGVYLVRILNADNGEVTTRRLVRQ